jgi:hypothetical protein
MLSTEFKTLRDIDESMSELRERNEARVAALKEQMGRKWVLHPANAPKKQVEQRVLR